MTDEKLSKVQFKIKRLFESEFPLLDVNKLIIKPTGPAYKVEWDEDEVVITQMLIDDNLDYKIREKLRELAKKKSD